ncbi:MAG: hypothetical protein H5T74_07250 [Actinobacteria bacterium]|nr:hypothetical protein [Actinomycetota bacterium]
MSGKLVRVEAIAFFNRYPHRRCTCEEVAEHLARTKDDVEPQLEALVRLGILDRFDEGRKVYYRARSAYTDGSGHREHATAGEEAPDTSLPAGKPSSPRASPVASSDEGEGGREDTEVRKAGGGNAVRGFMFMSINARGL